MPILLNIIKNEETLPGLLGIPSIAPECNVSENIFTEEFKYTVCENNLFGTDSLS